MAILRHTTWGGRIDQSGGGWRWRWFQEAHRACLGFHVHTLKLLQNNCAHTKRIFFIKCEIASYTCQMLHFAVIMTLAMDCLTPIHLCKALGAVISPLCSDNVRRLTVWNGGIPWLGTLAASFIYHQWQSLPFTLGERPVGYVCQLVVLRLRKC